MYYQNIGNSNYLNAKIHCNKTQKLNENNY